MPRTRAPKNDYPVAMLTVGPFGGIDPTTEAYYVPQVNFVDMLNLVPNNSYGGFVTALGRQKFLPAPLPGQCRGFSRFVRPGFPEGYVFAVDIGLESGYGALYYSVPGGTPQLLALPAGFNLTFGAQYSFVADQQWIFLTNGVDTPLKIDQNLVVTYWGIVAPTTAPTLLASGTASTMVGTYYYSVTFGNTSQESSQGAVSLPITVTDMGIALAGIPVSTDPQVTQRNIYRLGGSNGQWSLVGTINDNTTTTFVDTTADTAVGHVLTVFRDPPPIFTAIASFQERIFGIGPESVIYFSNLGEPYAFNDETGNLPVGVQSLDDTPVGLASTGSALSIMKANSQYAVFGNTDSNFIVNRISDIGCTGLRSIWQGNGICGWVSHQGSYLWDGSTAPNNISDGNFAQSNIKKILDNLTENDFDNATSFYYDRMIHHSFPTLNKTVFYDIRTQNWFVLGWACDQVYYRPESLSFKVLGTNLEAPGEIDTWFAAPGDFGNEITAYGLTGIVDSGDFKSTKIYRYVIVQAPIQNATLGLTTYVNPGAQQSVDNYALQMDGSDPTGAGPKFQISLPTKMKGFQVQLKVIVISNQTVHVQKVGIFGWLDRQFIQEG